MTEPDPTVNFHADRRAALKAAVHLDRRLAAPILSTIHRDGCSRRDCDCHQLTPEQYEAWARAIGDATTDRVLRIAERFRAYLADGTAGIDLDAALAELAGDGD